MNHIFILKNFISFLKRNKAYEIYLHCLNKSRGESGGIEFVVSTFASYNHYKGGSLISRAFSWGETDNGYEYWNKLNSKWVVKIFLIYRHNGW
jgi:hypothetical protein